MTPRGPGTVAFLPIEGLSREDLMRVLAAFAPTALVDLRPCPVFDGSRFRHREMVDHLDAVGILHVEVANLRDQHPPPASSLGTRMLRARIRAALDAGPTLCVVDVDACLRGWLDEARALFRESPGYRFEMHPRSVPGLRASAW